MQEHSPENCDNHLSKKTTQFAKMTFHIESSQGIPAVEDPNVVTQTTTVPILRTTALWLVKLLEALVLNGSKPIPTCFPFYRLDELKHELADALHDCPRPGGLPW